MTTHAVGQERVITQSGMIIEPVEQPQIPEAVAAALSHAQNLPSPRNSPRTNSPPSISPELSDPPSPADEIVNATLVEEHAPETPDFASGVETNFPETTTEPKEAPNLQLRALRAQHELDKRILPSIARSKVRHPEYLDLAIEPSRPRKSNLVADPLDLVGDPRISEDHFTTHQSNRLKRARADTRLSMNDALFAEQFLPIEAYVQQAINPAPIQRSTPPSPGRTSPPVPTTDELIAHMDETLAATNAPPPYESFLFKMKVVQIAAVVGLVAGLVLGFTVNPKFFALAWGSYEIFAAAWHAEKGAMAGKPYTLGAEIFKLSPALRLLNWVSFRQLVKPFIPPAQNPARSTLESVPGEPPLDSTTETGALSETT